MAETLEQAGLSPAEIPGNRTLTLMRAAVRRALRRRRRHLRIWVGSAATVLVVVTTYGYWRIARLKAEKASIDQRIGEVEARLANIRADRGEAARLLAQLDTYQTEGESVERNVFYRLGARDRDTYVGRGIRELMTEFGAPAYSIPPEFAERVNYYIRRYQGPDKPLMDRALYKLDGKVEVMRRMLERANLPPDLAYIPLVESTLAPRETSAAGARGLWQLMPSTARALGLRVNRGVDQRYELRPATQAACRYLKRLILDFGSGSSVMLALAAYNLGPSAVKTAILKNVEDPISERDFWYLYRIHALPIETREYVPKVFAAILIGREPQRFGF